MLEFEVKSWKIDGIEKTETQTKTTVVVTSGIVGDSYGHHKWTTIVVTTPSPMSDDAIAAEIQNKAEEMVTEKFPNT